MDLHWLDECLNIVNGGLTEPKAKGPVLNVFKSATILFISVAPAGRLQGKSVFFFQTSKKDTLLIIGFICQSRHFDQDPA